MHIKLNPSRSFIALLAAAWFLSLHAAGIVQAQIQDRPKVSPEQKKLESFVGRWTYSGTLRDTPLGPGGTFAGKSVNRMILDGLFLESKSEDKGMYGGKQMVWKGVSIQRYDPIARKYVDQSFDNDGYVGNGFTTADRGTWTTTSVRTDSAGKTSKFKSSATFSPDGKTMTSKAEVSLDDGKTWLPLWDATQKRVGR